MEMSNVGGGCSLHFYLLLFLYPLLQLLPGLADDSLSLSSKSTTNAEHHSTSKTSIGVTILLVCLGILSVVGFSACLFKIWQKKKRDAQQARLLKLFEDDNELEVELGIRD